MASVHTDHGDDQDDCFIIGGHFTVATNDTDDELGFASIDGHTNEDYLRRKQNAILAYGPISANMENTYHSSTNKYVFKEEGSTEHGIMWKVFTGTTDGDSQTDFNHGVPNGMKRIVGVHAGIQRTATETVCYGSGRKGGTGSYDFQTAWNDTQISLREVDSGLQSKKYTASVYYTAYDLY